MRHARSGLPAFDATTQEQTFMMVLAGSRHWFPKISPTGWAIRTALTLALGCALPAAATDALAQPQPTEASAPAPTQQAETSPQATAPPLPTAPPTPNAGGCDWLRDEAREGRFLDLMRAELSSGAAKNSELYKKLGVADSDAAVALLRDDGFSLVECESVRADSDELCHLVDDPKDPKCAEVVYFYRALRNPKADKSWKAPDGLVEMCARSPGMNKKICEQARDAIRSGKPELCPTEMNGDGLRRCRGYASLDARMCDGEKECVKDVPRFKLIEQGGLTALAGTVTGHDKILVEAALGNKNACKPLVERLHSDCRRRFQLGGGGATPAAGTPKPPASSGEVKP